MLKSTSSPPNVFVAVEILLLENSIRWRRAGGNEKRRVSIKLIMAARFFKKDSLHYSQSSICQEEGLDGYTVFKRISTFFGLIFSYTLVI